MTDAADASASHPSSNGVVLKVVRRSSLLDLIQSGVVSPSFVLVNDRSYTDTCVRCHDYVFVSEAARSIVVGVQRVDVFTNLEGHITETLDVRHVEPRPIVLVCDVCMPTPIPDPSTVKRETQGGT